MGEGNFAEALLLAFESPAIKAMAVALVLMLILYGLVYDEDRGSWFTAAVELSTICAIGIGVIVFELMPSVLSGLGVTAVDVSLLLAGLVLVSGIAGAIRDVLAWLRGEWREPPPPFQ